MVVIHNTTMNHNANNVTNNFIYVYIGFVGLWPVSGVSSELGEGFLSCKVIQFRKCWSLFLIIGGSDQILGALFRVWCMVRVWGGLNNVGCNW